jgi:hypothetical protein
VVSVILILCEAGTEPTGQAVAGALAKEYTLGSSPVLLPPDPVWGGTPQWDDLLVVVYGAAPLSAGSRAYVEAFRAAHSVTDPGDPTKRRPGGFVLPVAADPAHVRPPDPLAGIKALAWDGSAANETKVVRAVGVCLGMALRAGENQVFVSYRATDGKAVAVDLYDRLKAAGLNPWLDEAPASDNLMGTDEVQDRIMGQLKLASMVLVVDTPDAPTSKWVHAEIVTAIGQLIPVLPVLVGTPRKSRFIRLAALDRAAAVKPSGVDGTGLSDAEWDVVRDEVEGLLLQTYIRRLRTHSTAEPVFVKAGFNWAPLDPAMRLFRSARQGQLGQMVVWSHCFIQDATDLPALKAYRDYLRGRADAISAQFKLCIYDRDRILSPPELDDIEQSLGELPFRPTHFTELAFLVNLIP